jgi:hypothetical protein
MKRDIDCQDTIAEFLKKHEKIFTEWQKQTVGTLQTTTLVPGRKR